LENHINNTQMFSPRGQRVDSWTDSFYFVLDLSNAR